MVVLLYYDARDAGCTRPAEVAVGGRDQERGLPEGVVEVAEPVYPAEDEGRVSEGVAGVRGAEYLREPEQGRTEGLSYGASGVREGPEGRDERTGDQHCAGGTVAAQAGLCVGESVAEDVV